MKIRRLIFIAGSLVAAAAVVCVALAYHWQRSQPVFKDGPKLASDAAHRDGGWFNPLTHIVGLGCRPRLELGRNS